MKRKFIIAALIMAGAPGAPALAQDGSLSVCADHKASANDVAFHCRRALRTGALSDAQSFGAQVNLGEALITLGQPSIAVEAFAEAIALGPRRVEPLIGRANALEDLNRREDAARDWLAAIRLAPESFDVRIGKGAFHLRTRAPAAALAEFDAALALEADDPDALFNRGLANLALERKPEAESDFSRVLEEYPADASAYYHRGRARAGRDDRGAVADFDQASAHAAEWSDPWYLSGRALERLGETEAANARFRRAFELGHKDPWLLNRITSLGG